MLPTSNAFEQPVGKMVFMERAWGRGGFLTRGGAMSLTSKPWQPGLLQLWSHTLPDKFRRQFRCSGSLRVAGAWFWRSRLVSRRRASSMSLPSPCKCPWGAVLPLSVALAVNLQDCKPPQLPSPASCRHHDHLLTHTHTCYVFWAATSGSIWVL